MPLLVKNTTTPIFIARAVRRDLVLAIRLAGGTTVTAVAGRGWTVCKISVGVANVISARRRNWDALIFAIGQALRAISASICSGRL